MFCSWVAFWLVKTTAGGEVPARTALGANAVLSVVNIGFGGKSRPPVGYSTALDMFIIMCFVSVFSSMIEFALINFIDTFVKRHKARMEEEAKKQVIDEEKRAEKERLEKEEKERKQKEKEQKHEQVHVQPLDVSIVLSTMDAIELVTPIEDDEFEDIDEDEEERPGLREYLDGCVKFMCQKVESVLEAKWGPVTEMYFYKNTTDVIYTIDEYSRRIFPITFLLLNLLYWSLYLYVFE